MRSNQHYSISIILLMIASISFGCKKHSNSDSAPSPEATPQKTIKIRYEVNSTVAAFDNEAYNKLMYTGTEGGYLFDTYKGTNWVNELTIADNGKSSISLHVDLLLNGDKATATGKIFINGTLKVTGNSTAPYYSNGRTQTHLDIVYR